MRPQLIALKLWLCDSHQILVDDEKMIPMQADSPALGQVLRIGTGRNKTTELGELGRQCSHLSGAQGYQNEIPAAAILAQPSMPIVLRMMYYVCMYVDSGP